MIMKDIGVGRCKSGESTKFDTMTKTKIIYGIKYSYFISGSVKYIHSAQNPYLQRRVFTAL